MKKRVIIDTETGEILDELNKGDKIVRASSVEYLKTTVDMVDFNDCKFIKLQHSFMDYIDELTPSELKITLNLMRYIRYGTGKITYDNGKIMCTSDMAKEFGINERNIYKMLKSLCDKEIICRGKEGKNYVYYMNPFICLKGNRVSVDLIKMFEKSKYNIKNEKSK